MRYITIFGKKNDCLVLLTVHGPEEQIDEIKCDLSENDFFDDIIDSREE